MRELDDAPGLPTDALVRAGRVAGAMVQRHGFGQHTDPRTDI